MTVPGDVIVDRCVDILRGARKGQPGRDQPDRQDNLAVALFQIAPVFVT